MWVCSLKCYGPLAILLLWIYVYPLVGRVGDASPDSITDIKIRKADQIPLGKVHFLGGEMAPNIYGAFFWAATHYTTWYVPSEFF